MLLLGVYIIIVISTRVRPTRWAAYCNILYFISRRASVARDRGKRDSSGKRGVGGCTTALTYILLLFLYRRVHYIKCVCVCVCYYYCFQYISRLLDLSYGPVGNRDYEHWAILNRFRAVFVILDIN